MKKITVNQNTQHTTELVIGLNTQQTLCAKINARGKDGSNVDIDILCNDRDERDLIEALLKKKRFKQSDGMRTKKEFSLESRSGKITDKWTDHVVLHGPKAEKMLKHICENFGVKLPESNFYLN